MGMRGPRKGQKQPMYGDTTILYMRRLATEGYESREAWEKMVKEGRLPKDAKLMTFRSMSGRAHIQWGVPGLGKQTVCIHLSPDQAHEVSQAAAVRGTTRNLLIQKLVNIAIKDRMFDAILDDGHDTKRPDATEAQARHTLRGEGRIPGNELWPKCGGVRRPSSGEPQSDPERVQPSEHDGTLPDA